MSKESPSADSGLARKRKAAGKSAAWYTIAAFTTKAIGFVTIPIFTRIMTLEEFGLFNNYVAWQAIFLCIFGLESYLTVNRARFDYGGSRLQEYQFTVLSTGVALSAALMAILFAVPQVCIGLTGLDFQYILILVLYVMFYPAFAMFQAFQRTQYKYKLSASLSLVTSLFSTVLSVVLVLTLSDALLGRIGGQYLPFVVLGAAMLCWYAKTGKARIRIEYLKYALPLCLPLIVSCVGGYALLVGSRIVAQHMCSPNEMAYISLAVTCAQISYVLVTTMNNAWAPWLMDCLHEKRLDEVRRTFYPYIWGTFIVTTVCSLLAPELVAILGGSEYAPAAVFLPAFIESMLFSMVASQYTYLETYYKQVKQAGFASLLVGVMHIGLCIVCTYYWGPLSLGYVNMLSYGLLVACHKLILKMIGCPDVFGAGMIGAPLLFALLFSIACPMLLSSGLTAIRYLLVGVLCALGVVLLKHAIGVFSGQKVK